MTPMTPISFKRQSGNEGPQIAEGSKSQTKTCLLLFALQEILQRQAAHREFLGECNAARNT